MVPKEDNLNILASSFHKIKKIWLAWAMLILGLLVTTFLSLEVKQNQEKETAANLSFACDQLTLTLQEHLNAHALILKGASALFSSSQNVTRQEWNAYIQTLHFKDHIEGIGFNQRIFEHELDAHISKVRAEGFLDYNISPEGKRDVYTPVVYIEPFESRNLHAFGFDTYSEPIRQKAMAKACDTGEATLTGKIQLMQETGQGNEVQAGTILYVPIYQNHSVHNSIEEKQQAIIGWISGAYRMNDLISGILTDWKHYEKEVMDVRIYDGNKPILDNLLFHNTTLGTQRPHSPFYQERTIDFNGHIWLLVVDVIPHTLKINHTATLLTFFGGLTLSFLLFGLLLSSIYTKINAKRIAKKLTKQLEESEFRWKFAIEGAGDGVWDWNIQTNKSLYSKRWKEMLGYDEYEILPTHQEWENRIHPDDKALVDNTIKAYFQGEIPIYSVEFRLQCKDGSYKWILSRGMVVNYDKQGKPNRMIGTHSDIDERKSTEKILQKLYTAIEQSPASVVITDLEACIEYVNPQFTENTGYQASEALGQNPRILQSNQMPKEIYLSIWNNITHGLSWRGELLNKRKNGELYWEEAHITPIKDDQGVITHYVGVKTDITARIVAEKKIESLLEEQNAILNSHIVGIAKLKNRRFIWVNEWFAKMNGYTQEELLGQSTRLLYPDEQSFLSYGEFAYPNIEKGEILRSELIHQHKNGSLKWYKIGGGLLHPQSDESIWSFVDITEQKQLEEQVHHMAFHDILTKLPNRRLLNDRLSQTMLHSKRNSTYCALMFLDLDNFKPLNDTYGHIVGDALLIDVATRLKTCVRELDTVARIGGDEFVIILNNLNKNKIESKKQAGVIAEKIRIALAKPYILNIEKDDHIQEQIQYLCTASIGIVVFLDNEMEQNEILKLADNAMYKAKINGRNQFSF